jgi:hypothetical protein
VVTWTFRRSLYWKVSWLKSLVKYAYSDCDKNVILNNYQETVTCCSDCWSKVDFNKHSFACIIRFHEIVQSEHTNYTIQCYHWLFYRVRVQTHAKKFYDLKHEFVILCTHSFTRLYIKNGKQYRGSCFCELLLSVQMKHQHLILGTLYELMIFSCNLKNLLGP